VTTLNIEEMIGCYQSMDRPNDVNCDPPRFRQSSMTTLTVNKAQ
jgi:hypothetical protein